MLTTLRRRALGAVATTALVTLAGSLWAPAEAAPAGPIAITCGAILHQDAYLAADLTCPTGNGVTAAASLSIDLRGHHLTGNRGGIGITIDDPANVKVTHGRLTGWGTGLTTAFTTPPAFFASITVIAVTFADNGTGLAAGDSGGGSESGYSFAYTVYRSWFVSNGVGLGGSVSNAQITVSGATFRNNQVAVLQRGDTDTVAGYITVADSELSNNRVGVSCHNTYCILNRNGFSANPVAVTSDGTETNIVMVGNALAGSTTALDLHGIFAEVDDSTFTGNKSAVFYDKGYGTLRDNVFSGNGTAVTMTDMGGRILGNVVSNNTGDGIVVGGDMELSDNISTFNHGWGINAPEAEDKGGNRAYGNYHSPQCVGVICTH